MAYGTINVDKVTNSDNITSGGLYGFKNRIINGAMVIDQRNAGAEINPAVNATYYLDRWLAVSSAASKFKIGQNAGSVTPPAGFKNYLGCTSLSAYSIGLSEAFGVRQIIEGFNFADLGWGTANAQTITISFWVRSSLTGLFGVGLGNADFSRAYAASYTINSANTWEYKTITIAGDTSGTWLSTNGIGLYLTWSMGYASNYTGTAGVWNAGSYFMPTGVTSVVGTNGATFYITGVQLEKGSTATSFDFRPYGTELALCQRYLPVINPVTYWVGNCSSTTLATFTYPFQVQPRVAPTGITIPALSNFALNNYAGTGGTPTSVLFSNASLNQGRIAVFVTAGSPTIVGGQTGEFIVGNSGYIQFTGCEL